MGFENVFGGVRADGKVRNENDFYPTPPFVTYAFIEHAKIRNVELPGKLWEPAAGRGWMAQELRQNLYDVVATDLHTYENCLSDVIPGQDFLTTDPAFHDSMGIITNPPYTQKLPFRLIDTKLKAGYKYISILCRATFFESGNRYHNLFSVNPPTEIMFFSRRFSCNEEMFFTDPFAGMVAYAWYVWDYREPRREGTQSSWIDTERYYKEWVDRIGPEELERLKSLVVKAPTLDPLERLLGPDTNTSE